MTNARHSTRLEASDEGADKSDGEHPEIHHVGEVLIVQFTMPKIMDSATDCDYGCWLDSITPSDVRQKQKASPAAKLGEALSASSYL